MLYELSKFTLISSLKSLTCVLCVCVLVYKHKFDWEYTLTNENFAAHFVCRGLRKNEAGAAQAAAQIAGSKPHGLFYEYVCLCLIAFIFIHTHTYE